MATLHLRGGLPCSGKTTLARALEQKYSALRLTPDEWHVRLFGQDEPEESYGVEAARRLWEASERLVNQRMDA